MRKKLLAIMSLAVLLVLMGAGSAFAIYSDVSGHWAAPEISSFVSQNIAKGYPDGTFKPNNQITRAEFIALVNRVFAFNRPSSIAFTDCAPKDWYYVEVAKAKTAGYISGYADNTIKPNQAITREEVAAIIQRILQLPTTTNQGVMSSLRDAQDISGWSRTAISIVLSNEFMTGYPDQTFRPQEPITRAEAVVTLYRAKNYSPRDVTFDRAGTYGTANTQTYEGNVTVSAASVTLQNMIIKGNLTLTEGIGEGNVELKNITVNGVTTVKGGGMHSILLTNSRLGKVTVNKQGGQVRLVASGTSVIGEVTLNSGAKLEESSLTGTGFSNILADTTLPVTQPIILMGNFDQAKINRRVNIELESGKVQNITVASTAGNANINIQDDATITSLTLNAAVNITGDGKIDTARVNVSGSTIQQTPRSVIKATGVRVTIGNYIAPTVSTTVPPALVVTQSREFKISTVANSAANTLAKWRLTIKNAEGEFPSLKEITANGQYSSVVFNSQAVALYPSSGIGVVNGERKFEIRFEKDGTYDYKFELIKVSDSSLLAKAEGKIEVTSDLVYSFQLAIAELFEDYDTNKAILAGGVDQEYIDTIRGWIEEDLVDGAPGKAELLQDLQKAQELLAQRNQAAAPGAVQVAENAIANLSTPEEINSALEAYKDALTIVNALPQDTGTSHFKTDLLTRLATVQEAIDGAVEQMVHNAEVAAQTLSTPADISAAQQAYDVANSLVTNLPEDTGTSSLKHDLQTKLTVVLQLIEGAVATQAVETAKNASLNVASATEISEAQDAYDDAYNLVTSLPEDTEISSLKTDLLNQLAEVEQAITEAVATEAVNQALEAISRLTTVDQLSTAQQTYENANTLVTSLPEDSSVKADLTSSLSTVQAAIEAALELPIDSHLGAISTIVGHSKTVYYNEVFTGTDNQLINYSFDVDQRDILELGRNADDSGILITPKTDGTAQVTVTATNLNGDTEDATFNVEVVANQVPTVEIIFENKEGYAGGPQVTVGMVKSHFADGDNDTLSFSANANNENIAEVTVDSAGELLIITPKTAGQTTITLWADDSYGGRISDAFQISVVDQPVKIKDIENVTINATTNIELNNYFADEDKLTFTTSPSDEIVSNSVYNSQLVITPLKTGSSIITVTATDDRGNTVESIFTVTVTAEINGGVDFLTSYNSGALSNTVSSENSITKSVVLNSGTEANSDPNQNPSGT